MEQQQLKRLVLNYEQREEAEELKGSSRSITEDLPNQPPLVLEAQNRPFKIRLAG